MWVKRNREHAGVNGDVVEASEEGGNEKSEARKENSSSLIPDTTDKQKYCTDEKRSGKRNICMVYRDRR